MCLTVRLKAHTMYFKNIYIWSTCGQRMLTKSGLNTHLEKVKIAILQYLLMKRWDEFLFREVLTIKNEKFVYNR